MLQRNDSGYDLVIPFEDEVRGIVHRLVGIGETVDHPKRVHALTLVDEAGEKLEELSDEALREINGIIHGHVDAAPSDDDTQPAPVEAVSASQPADQSSPPSEPGDDEKADQGDPGASTPDPTTEPAAGAADPEQQGNQPSADTTDSEGK